MHQELSLDHGQSSTQDPVHIKDLADPDCGVVQAVLQETLEC